MPEPPGAGPLGPWRAFLSRFALAHFIAYPVATVAALAATPLALWIKGREITETEASGASWQILQEALNKYHVSSTEAAQVQIVVEFVLYFCIGVFSMIHVAAIPWAAGAARAAKRTDAPGARQSRTPGFRLFVVTTAATLVAVALLGAAGWTWLFTQ
jgi:hypothetical protein